MITRDEAAVIEACLRHHRELVDEIVVVDTGSTDGTPELARRCGAAVEIIAWPDDFAAARNVSLSLASADWILVLDADERLEASHFGRLRALVNRAAVPGYTLNVATYSNDSSYFLWQPLVEQVPGAEDYTGYYLTSPLRLFERRPELRFGGIIHESLEPAFRAAGLSWQSSDVLVHHFTFSRPGEQQRAKRLRYLALCEAKTRRHPDDPQAQLELGMVALDAKDFGRAIEACAHAVRLKPDKPLPWEHLGAALIRAARWQAAVGCFMEAIRRFPDVPSFYVGCGEALFHLGRPAEAWTILRRCLELDPMNFRANINLGVTAIELGNGAVAREAFERARTINPRSDLSELNLGLLALRESRWAQALEHFHRAIVIHPTRWQTLAGIGACYFEAGNYGAAAEQLERAAAAPDHGPEVYVRLCAVEVARGNPSAALAHARTAAARDGRYQSLEAMVSLRYKSQDDGRGGDGTHQPSRST